MKKIIYLIVFLFASMTYAQGSKISAPATTDVDSLVVFTPDKRVNHVPYSVLYAKLLSDIGAGGGTQTLDETLTLGNSSGQGLDLHTLRYRHYEGNIGSSSYTDINGDYIRARNSLASGEAYTQISEQGLESKYGATYSLIRPSYQASGTYRLKFPKVDNKTPIMSINGVFADDETGDFTFNGLQNGFSSTGSYQTSNLENLIGDLSGSFINVDNNINSPFENGNIVRNHIIFDAPIGGYIFKPANYGFKLESPEGFTAALGGGVANWGLSQDVNLRFPNVGGTPVMPVSVNGVFADASGNVTINTGDVTKVGIPVNNQIGIWTGDGTIKGNSKLTYNGVSLINQNGSAGSVEVKEDDIILTKGSTGSPAIIGGDWQYKTHLVFDTTNATTQATVILKNESGVNALISDIDTAINSITPTSLLTDIKTVDGTGSGLDSDTLDGLDSTSFLPATLEVAEIDPASKFTDVKLALFDTQAELDAASLSTNTIAWSKDSGDPIDSTDITYDNTVSGLTASNVKSAIDELKSDIDNVPTGEGIMKSATITITNPDMSLGAVEQEIVNVSEGGVGKILMVDSVMFHASGFSGSTGNQNITIYHSSETTDLISASRVFLYTGGTDSAGKFNSVNFNPYNAVQGENQGLKIRLTSANLDNLTGSLKVTVYYTVFTL